MEKIALLPGGFKPPHAGHYNMAKWLAANTDADTVVVKVGSKEREGITRDQSLAMWEIYRSTDPDPLAKRLTILPSQSPSPVRDVYDFIELEAPEGSMVYLALGEKDANDKRYASIPKFAEPRGIQFKTVIVPPQLGGVSGTDMRGFITNDQKEEFQKYLPTHLSNENKDKIWDMLAVSIGEGYTDPDDKMLDYMKSSEWKAGMPDGPKDDDTSPVIKYQRGGMYSGGGMGAGGMYEGDEVDEMMGTMNKQEMDKHNANMKKLSKHLSKVNSQGNMVPVPTNLTKGLKRKLYEKVTKDSIICDNCGWDWKIKDGGDDLYICHKCNYDNTPKLHEGRYDNEVMKQSRYIVNLFKSTLGKKSEETIEVSLNLFGSGSAVRIPIPSSPDQRGEKNDMETFTTVGKEDKGIKYYLETNFYPQGVKKLGDIPYIINAAVDEFKISIQIDYNPSSFPEAYNNLVAEVKDALRHELEHFGQYYFNKGVEPDGTDPDDVPSFEYFTLDYEIPAFVQGLYKTAKTKKITLTQAIDDFLDERKAELTDEEAAKVKQIWTNWARENLPAAQLDEGPIGDFTSKIKTAAKEQAKDFKSFVPLLKKWTIKSITPEEKSKLETISKDILKSTAIGVTWPILGLTGHALIGAAIKKLSKGKYAGFLPSKLASVVEYKEEISEMKLFSKEWWKDHINESILDEAKANTHLTHLEELILTEGEDGYNKAKSFLLELIQNLKGHSNAKVNTSVKWDGAPAMFVGTHPENGKFFVGTKSVFNKSPKINYTKEDIDINHGHAPGLANKLKLALDYLPSLGIKNILQGDFMFDSSTISTKELDGVAHYVFKPNTITYAVESDSELGKRIITSNFGIVFHTTYEDLSGTATFGADISSLNKNPKIWFDDAWFDDDTGTVTITTEEADNVLSKIKEADQIKVNYEELPSSFLNIYINSEIRVGEFLKDPLTSYNNFLTWFQGKMDKKMEKLKSDRGREKLRIKSDEEINTITSNKENIINAFKLSKLLAEAKSVFIEKYNNAIYKTKHFVDDGAGGLKVTNPEGYVAVDHIGNGVKLVDRLEFSRANFAMDKGFTK